MNMRIIETYCRGKGNPDANEDILVTTDDFVLVVDGATDKTGHIVEGMKGGRFVAIAVADLHRSGDLPPDIDMSGWIEAITRKVDAELVRVSWPAEVQRPAASVLAYSVSRREMFRVGDCHYRVGDAKYMGGKAIDDHHGDIRAAKLKACLEEGARIADLLENDPGRDLILRSLANQYNHANAADGEFAYPVVNGDPVPRHLMEPAFSVPAGSFVVMTSDGFDFPAATLSDTLSAQSRSYEIDPLRIGLDGARASTKGLVAGMTQHDDQTYVSFRTS
jgi:glycerophosphoryl diester phosphodiesterase